MVFEAARLRRQWAGRLFESGDAQASARELSAAMAVFARLGARPEWERSLDQCEEAGLEPPPWPSTAS